MSAMNGGLVNLTIIQQSAERLPLPTVPIIHACRSEAAETDGRRGFSQVRATQAYLQLYVEETEREKPRRARGSAAAAKSKGPGPPCGGTGPLVTDVTAVFSLEQH